MYYDIHPFTWPYVQQVDVNFQDSKRHEGVLANAVIVYRSVHRCMSVLSYVNVSVIWLETLIELKLFNSSFSSSKYWIQAFRAYPLSEIRQTVPCRAIRGSSISVSSSLLHSSGVLLALLILILLIVIIILTIRTLTTHTYYYYYYYE